MTLRRLLPCLLLLACGAGLIGPGVAAPARAQELRIATWNLAWLVSPDTALAARLACRAGRRATLPCNVTRELARDSADLARLARHGRRLDADVVALQEVENIAIAGRVLPGYRFCLTTAQGLQQLGFAIRPTLPHRCGPAVESLTGGGRGRPGMQLTLLPAAAEPIELLAVHLKSGCARDPVDTGAAACVLLGRQARALGEWIATREAEGTPFLVLGDLNRPLPDTGEDAFWQSLQPGSFVAAATTLPFANCQFGAPYTNFIDHVLVSRSLVPRLAEPAFRQWRFSPRDALRYRLSDHCPVSVSLIRSAIL